MSVKSWSGWLLAALLLAPCCAWGQVAHDHSSDSSSASPTGSGGSARTPDLSRVEQLIVQGTNQFRKEQGRGRLRVHPQLTRAARDFAAYMARTNKFSHTADGKQPWDRTAAQGYQDCIIAENIAWEYRSDGFTTHGLATALVEGWKKSPHHRKNMLDPDVDEIGVGVAYSKDTQRYYAVQDFGRPRSEEIAFTIANDADVAVDYTVDGKSFSLAPGYTVTQHRCRPPEVSIRLPGEGQGNKQEKFHPDNGSHYVIRGKSTGSYTVEEE